MWRGQSPRRGMLSSGEFGAGWPDVAAQAGSSIAEAIAAADENSAMQMMARGAAQLARRLHHERLFDGVLVLGGSMGTDLALDLCAALPLGVPKYIVSTVSFGPMIPPERLAADVQMILWAGGLFGLSAVCKASLSQAADRDDQLWQDRPALRGQPETGTRGAGVRGGSVPRHRYGGAFESLAADGAFAAVMDFVGWQPMPGRFKDTPTHAHNRLLTSVVQTPAQRRKVAWEICAKLAQSAGPVTFVLPTPGGNEWDRAGGPLEDAEGLAAFCDGMRKACLSNVAPVELDAHINDSAFTDTVLAQFDDWPSRGVVRKQRSAP